MKSDIHVGRLLVGVVAALSVVSVVKAGIVNVAANQTGSPLVAVGVSNFVTTGADMAGMLVTVNFSGANPSQTVPWATTGANSGAAGGSIGNGAWSLGVSGDTGATTAPPSSGSAYALTGWTLTNSADNVSITSVVLDGLPGNTVFDRDSTLVGPRPAGNIDFVGAEVGTPNSAFGIDHRFFAESADNFTVGVTYSNILQLSSSQSCSGGIFAGNTQTGCGDEWRTLRFSFDSGTFQRVGPTNATWVFAQDTDNLGAPEPLTMGLMALGLIALFAYRKRRVNVLSS